MKIAVITGASSGMGKAFTKQIDEKYQELDEIWVIARKKEGLEGLKKEISKLCILPMDLTDRQALEEFSTLLKREKPCIQILVESAGMGIQKKIEDTAVDDLRRMTELNCTALTAFVAMCLPYCEKGSRILCLASGAAFVPQPSFAVYAASKSYVLSFARALGAEQKGRIVVTAVCPGPVDTPFLEKMGGKENMPFYKKPFIADAEAVVKKALKDSERGREISVYGFAMKALRAVCKIVPIRLLMRFM